MQRFIVLSVVFLASTATAEGGGDDHASVSVDGVCEGFGPQTPRDIDQPAGTSPRRFSLAPEPTRMNLCNIHFHVSAEHRARDFSVVAAGGEDGRGGGYQCNLVSSLPAEVLTPLSENSCHGVEAGDTVEVHWVYSSCDVTPGVGLGACLSASCANPDLRVEAQVFALVNDPSALAFGAMDAGAVVDGYHQAKSLPAGTGEPVVFRGSTTGPSYDDQNCSPLQVTWSVRPQCAQLDITSLSRWCQSNVFEEDHAHGVRPLVTHPELLSPID
ncbi:MAG: cadmium carbonic anhydrase [Thermoanaerobaculia bacterium]|nr:cadmium carbonic anhydrase [Thermoanaerobaculia bacterium]